MKTKGVLPNTIIGVAGLLLSLYVWISSNAFPEDLYNPTNSDFFPKICAAGLAGSCVALLVSSLIFKANDEYDSLTLKKKENLNVLVIILLGFAMLAGLKTIGFLIAASVYMLAVEAILGYRNWKVGIPSTILFTAAVYFIFKELLMISLPLGVMKGLF